jgi:hypothetical protein
MAGKPRREVHEERLYLQSLVLDHGETAPIMKRLHPVYFLKAG